jgi:hypothetical protein
MSRTSGRGRWVPAVVGVLAVLPVLLVGCTSTQPQVETSTPVETSTVPDAAATTTAPDSAAITIAPGSCPDVSGWLAATIGVLSTGPFTEDVLRAQPKDVTQRKLWVASQREGMDEAILTVTDPTGVPTRQTRPPGMDFIAGAKQFYAGGIHIGSRGPYRIDLTIGPDTMCVVAVYE